MLDKCDYQLLAKYESADNSDFNTDELSIVCKILNVRIASVPAASLAEYRSLISQALHEQNKIMTDLGGEFLNQRSRGARLGALSYLVENIASIRSPYMLGILADLMADNGE
jgi:hypothetical protein